MENFIFRPVSIYMLYLGFNNFPEALLLVFSGSEENT